MVAIEEDRAALYLLGNEDLTDIRRISILGSASLQDSSLTPRSNIDSFLVNVSNEYVATVIR